MKSLASAPGKAILFGEHSVVYGEPAIAGAVNRRATVSIRRSRNNKTTLRSKDLKFEAILDTEHESYTLKYGKPGIIRYILNALYKFHDHSPIDINLSINIPIGSGLGSSAAVTVATLAALFKYHGIYYNKVDLARYAHGVEEDVQGMASPLDTLVSTYGGLIYLSREKTPMVFSNHINSSFVIGYTTKYGNTGRMVRGVKNLRDNNPYIIDPIIETMGYIANEARIAILNENIFKIGSLMNINQGLLDSLGVNTPELSRMIYLSRKYGAIGSKITGSGGGGSIIALCPRCADRVSRALNRHDNTIKIKFSKDGVLSRRRS